MLGCFTPRARIKDPQLPDPLHLLYQELTCPICLDLYTDPHIFTGCSHAFCRTCVLERLEGKGITKMECPTCHQPGWKKDLVPNHKYQNLANILRVWTLEDGRTLTEAIQSSRDKPAKATEHATNGQRPKQGSKARQVQSRKVAAFKVPCKVTSKGAEAGQQPASEQAPFPRSDDRAAGIPGASIESVGAQERSPGKRPTLQKSHADSHLADEKGCTSTPAVAVTARDMKLKQPVTDLTTGIEGKSGKGPPAMQSGVRVRQMQVGRRRRMAQLPRKSTRFAAMAAGIEVSPLQGRTAPLPESSARDRSAKTTGNGRITQPAAENGATEGAEKTGSPDQMGEEGTLVLAAADGKGKRKREEADVGFDPAKEGEANETVAGRANPLAHGPTEEKQDNPLAEKAVPGSGECGDRHAETTANRRAEHSISEAVGTGVVLENNQHRTDWAQGFTAEVTRAAQPTQLHPLHLQMEAEQTQDVQPAVNAATAEALTRFGPDWAAQALSQQALGQLCRDPAALAEKLEEAHALQQALDFCDRMLQQHSEIPESVAFEGTERSMTQIDAHLNQLGVRFSEPAC